MVAAAAPAAPSDSPLRSASMATDDEVLAANHRFYEAFEAGDLDAMSDVWAHDDAVLCTHPGWSTLHGWAAVSASWFTLFHNDQTLQFIVTNERARVNGDVAWVTCDENILGDGPGGTAAALNLFTRSNGVWRMVAHHASPVAPRV
jgi:ketosteroid isomerase-like protein